MREGPSAWHNFGSMVFHKGEEKYCNAWKYKIGVYRTQSTKMKLKTERQLQMQFDFVDAAWSSSSSFSSFRVFLFFLILFLCSFVPFPLTRRSRGPFLIVNICRERYMFLVVLYYVIYRIYKQHSHYIEIVWFLLIHYDRGMYICICRSVCRTVFVVVVVSLGFPLSLFTFILFLFFGSHVVIWWLTDYVHARLPYTLLWQLIIQAECWH